MTKLQDYEHSVKTLADNARWLDENVNNVVHSKRQNDDASLDRWHDEGGSQAATPKADETHAKKSG